jgi:hypothetical protein
MTQSRFLGMTPGLSGRKPTFAEVAEILHAARADVLRAACVDRKWGSANEETRADRISDAIEDLLRRAKTDPDWFKDEGHVRNALTTAVLLRRDNLYRRGRNRQEVPLADLDGYVDVHADGADESEMVDAVTLRQLQRYAADCLAEMSPTQEQIFRLHHTGTPGKGGQRIGALGIAKKLGLSGAPVVQKELRAADRTIEQFAVILESGRLCGSRSAPIRSYIDGTATDEQVRLAETHLHTCPTCKRAYENTRDRLGREVAALIPMPLLAAAGADRYGVIGRTFGRLDGVRDTIVGIFSRPPAGADVVAGSAASVSVGGVAIGAKVVIGACLIAGGGAVCDTVIVPGLGHHKPAAKHARKRVTHQRSAALTPVTVPGARITAVVAAPSPRARTASATTSTPSVQHTTASSATHTVTSAPAADLSPNTTGGGFETGGPTAATSTSLTQHAHATSRGGFDTAAGTPHSPSPSAKSRAFPARDFDTTGFESGTP